MDLERVANNSFIEQLSQLEAAERQLDRAIQLFLVDHDYICAITLAGAAEEILGGALAKEGKKPMNEHLKGILKQIILPELTHKEISDQHLNKIRNRLKHHTDLKDEGIEDAMDLVAMQMIIRAIGNYGFLTETVTPKSVEFFAWLHQHRPDVFEEAAKCDGMNFKID